MEVPGFQLHRNTTKKSKSYGLSGETGLPVLKAPTLLRIPKRWSAGAGTGHEGSHWQELSRLATLEVVMRFLKEQRVPIGAVITCGALTVMCTVCHGKYSARGALVSNTELLSQTGGSANK